jgi:hypothetical protein
MPQGTGTGNQLPGRLKPHDLIKAWRKPWLADEENVVHVMARLKKSAWA